MNRYVCMVGAKNEKTEQEKPTLACARKNMRDSAVDSLFPPCKLFLSAELIKGRAARGDGKGERGACITGPG